MAPNPLGIFITKTFPFVVFDKPKGLNFLDECSLYKTPVEMYPMIGPKVIVEWSEE